MSDKQWKEDCSLCGAPAIHHASDEGTHYMTYDDSEVDHLVLERFDLKTKITELEQQLALEKEIVQSTSRAYTKTKAKLTEQDKLLDECEGAFEQLASQCIGFRVSENQDIVELMVRYATAWLTKLMERKK